MKKAILLLITIFAFNFSFSQVNPHAIGLRLTGTHTHSGAEVSYQHGFGEKNRLELDLGIRSHSDYFGSSLAVIFHWDWNIVAGLNWFVGPGLRVSHYIGKHGLDDGFGLALGGQIGLEYDFNEHDVPLLVGIDARPMHNFLNSYGRIGYGTAVSGRYTF